MRAPPRGRARQCRAAGFTYIGVLFAVALAGVALTLTAQVWRTVNQRAKEAQLLFVGGQYREAIRQYYEQSPGPRVLPKTLEELLQDNRYPNVRRYLRNLYPDPMTGRLDWEIKRAPDGGILAIHSRSNEPPLKVAGFGSVFDFSGRAKYSEWVFAYQPGDAAGAAGGDAAAANAAQNPSGGNNQGAGSDSAAAAPAEDPAARNARCQIIYNNDLRACTAQRNTFGAGPGELCVASAEARNSECNAGVALRGLENRRPRGR